jgi:pilus assembly protein CpaF
MIPKKRKIEEKQHAAKKITVPFEQLLSECQEYMSKNYAATLYDNNAKNADMAKQYAKQFIKERNYYVEGFLISEIVEKMYVEMAEYGFLTPFLKRADIEEVNINAWDDIAVHPVGGKPYKLREHFYSPQHAVDIIRRLLHNNKLVFDESRPIVTGYLGTNVRITAVHTAVVGEQAAVSASIRLVNPQKITTEEFIKNGTCTGEMHDFLTNCYIYGVSQCFAGGTGSGKTTFMADVMRQYPSEKRVITIEKSVREFDLRRYDADGKPLNNVLHFVTRDSDEASRNVTILDLVTAALTMHPDAICVAEMKNEEAWEAQEAARTGHTVLTTTHAGSTRGVYTRLATLCLQKYSQVPFEIILRLVCEAFPVAVFLKYMPDGSRKITQIAECRYVGGEKYDVQPLWEFVTEQEVSEELPCGKIRTEISGRFVKSGKISEELRVRLAENGMPENLLKRYL